MPRISKIRREEGQRNRGKILVKYWYLHVLYSIFDNNWNRWIFFIRFWITFLPGLQRGDGVCRVWDRIQDWVLVKSYSLVKKEKEPKKGAGKESKWLWNWGKNCKQDHKSLSHFQVEIQLWWWFKIILCLSMC